MFLCSGESVVWIGSLHSQHGDIWCSSCWQTRRQSWHFKKEILPTGNTLVLSPVCTSFHWFQTIVGVILIFTHCNNVGIDYSMVLSCIFGIYPSHSWSFLLTIARDFYNALLLPAVLIMLMWITLLNCCMTPNKQNIPACFFKMFRLPYVFVMKKHVELEFWQNIQQNVQSHHVSGIQAWWICQFLQAVWHTRASLVVGAVHEFGCA